MKIFKIILKIIAFFLIFAGLIITVPLALPAAFYYSFSGINMYNQKGIIKFLAKPYLYLHSLLCKLFNSRPYKGNF